MGKFLRERYKNIGLIVLIIFFALFLKFKDSAHFIGNAENVFSTYDALRYARFAKEIQSGTYSSIDYLSNVPDYRANSEPPFLLPQLAVLISSSLNIKLEHIFAFLPPVLGVLFVIPLFLWLKTFTNKTELRYVFAGSALLGLFNFIYAIRTPPGYFDTDCLVLFFIFSIVLFITYAVKEKENAVKSYTYVVVAAVLYKLFLWWYDVYLFGVLFIASLFIGLYLFKHETKHLMLKLFLFIFFLDINSLWRGYNTLMSYFKSVFLKESVDLLPLSIFSTINEFKPLTFGQFVSFTTDNYATAIIGLICIAFIFVRFFRHMAIALPIICIGLASFKMGNRYIMYLAPFMGMGLGCAVYFSMNFMKKRYAVSRSLTMALGLILIVFICFPLRTFYYSPKPFLDSQFIKSLKYIKDNTEKNSFVWTWWDMGFIVQYFSERGTYIDGANYHPVKMYFIARSLMTDDELYAKRAISFISNNLTKDYLKKGTTLTELSGKAAKYDPILLKPVYVMLDRSMVEYQFIHKLGLNIANNDADASRMPLFQKPVKCNKLGATARYDCLSLFAFDSESAAITQSDNVAVKSIYKEIWYIDRNRGIRKLLHSNDNASSEKILQIISKDNDIFFMAIDFMVKNSVFNRMYALYDKFDTFIPMLDDFPHMVVYRAGR